MKYELVKLLRCPTCGQRLELAVIEEEHNEVKTGTLTCTEGHVYQISRFVPRFVDADKYADSFSRQRLYVRKHFSHYRNDRSGDAQFLPTTGFSAEAMKSGVSLEIGCGYGRFVDVVQRSGGRIVGVDLSTHSIDLAQDFVGLRENVFLVQADLFALPFERETFQHIYSIGVLHHTPDTKRAFEAIVPYLAQGGHIAIWVYHPMEKRSSNVWRAVTTRLSHRVLYGACIANQVLFSWIRGLPGGWRFSHIIPGAGPRPGQTFWLRVLGDFDNLSPKFAYVHNESEVAGWFRDAGLKDVRVLTRRTAVTGTKMSSVPLPQR
jgi:SAM-dependent methyltransferase